MAVINGTSGDDALRGTKAPDTINGLGGDDRLYDAGDGNVLRGGAGDDVIVVEGVESFDGPGLNSLYGGGGRDVIVSGESLDSIYGGAGDDRLFGGFGPDWFYWRSGDGGDVIDGGTSASSSDDDIDSDQDTFDFTLADTTGRTSFIVKGDGVITVDVADPEGAARLTITEAETFVVHGGAGADTVDFRGYSGPQLFTASAYPTYDVVIEAGEGDDRVFATAYADLVQDGAGDDFISLRGGNDVCVVGGGDDRIYTGSGRDTITIDGDAIGNGQRTVVDFNPAKDGINFYNARSAGCDPGIFDTNDNGYLDRNDDGVGVENGALTIDLGRFASNGTGPNTLTLLGITKLDMDAFDFCVPGM